MSEQIYYFRGRKPCGCVTYLKMTCLDYLEKTDDGARVASLMRGGVLFDYVPVDEDHPVSFTRCERHAIGAGPVDARLRDAAPDLLAALKAMVDGVARTGRSVHWSDCPLLQAESAIAKAEGR